MDLYGGYTNIDNQAAQVSAQTTGNSVLYNNFATGGGGAGISPVTFIIGLIGLLFLMKFLGESEKATGIQTAHLQIGGYNLIAVTVTSIVGIVLLKVLFNYWQIPGITDLINAA